MANELIKTGGDIFVAAIQSASELAKPAIETGCRLIESLLGEPCRVTGALVSDQIYAWQWGNRIRIAIKAKKRLDKCKVPASVLPMGFLIPILDACGNVDDESLQEMWASLLVEGIRDEESRQATYRVTLQSMNSKDAKWLMSLRRDEIARPGQLIRTQIVPRRGTADGARGGSDEMNGRLVALGLLAPIIGRELQSVMDLPGYSGPRLAIYSYELSDYGPDQKLCNTSASWDYH